MTSRTMLTLPPVAWISAKWRLPLCDASAMALAAAVVESDDAKCAADLAAVLTIDPALAVWAVISKTAQPQSGTIPGAAESIASVAQWIAPRVIELLNWRSSPPAIMFTAQQHGTFAALVAETIPAARDCVRGLSPDQSYLHPRCLAMLTAKWREWLQAAAVENSVAEIEWNRIGESWPLESVTVTESLSADSRAAGDEAWRRWLTEIPEVHAMLPSLASHMRRLLELETEFERTLESKKLDSLKEFAYGAGHELNNPLANIASRAQMLIKEETHPDRRRRLAAINTQAFRAHEMLADMMLFARPPQLRLEKVDLAQLASEVLSEILDEARGQEITLNAVGCEAPMFTNADPVQLRVALKSLCVNSLEAIGRSGSLTIELHQYGEFVEIAVSDDGPGIPPEIVHNIFDPFFSGREAGRGLGFGLCKCWRIVNSHGGTIEVDDIVPHGARVTVRLPRYALDRALMIQS